ncbi:MAG: hypothetical protein PHI83_08620 [Sphaerochaetaceae bacterium]|nr:hypothetical protein [Sphaerochaetaceae bacterium]
MHHDNGFLAVTGHDIYTDTRKLTDDRLTMIQGLELWANAASDRDIHVHFLWADLDACKSDYTRKRCSNSYHWSMQHFMRTGYNHAHSHITCGM